MKCPKYNTPTFCDVWHKAADFLADCKDADIELKISDDNCTTLFYLLYAKWGNNPIANRDICQFKYKVFSIIFQYGPEWQRKLEIQDTLRNLPESDILKASEGIVNMASNPDTPPSTGLTEELPFVNGQTVNKIKKSKVEAYRFLWSALNSNLTDEFLKRFEPCFSKFLDKNVSVIYCSDEEDEQKEE